MQLLLIINKLFAVPISIHFYYDMTVNIADVISDRNLRFLVTECKDELSGGESSEVLSSEENGSFSPGNSLKRFSRSISRKFSNPAIAIEDWTDDWPDQKKVQAVAKRSDILI